MSHDLKMMHKDDENLFILVTSTWYHDIFEMKRNWKLCFKPELVRDEFCSFLAVANWLLATCCGSFLSITQLRTLKCDTPRNAELWFDYSGWPWVATALRFLNLNKRLHTTVLSTCFLAFELSWCTNLLLCILVSVRPQRQAMGWMAIPVTLPVVNGLNDGDWVFLKVCFSCLFLVDCKFRHISLVALTKTSIQLLLEWELRKGCRETDHSYALCWLGFEWMIRTLLIVSGCPDLCVLVASWWLRFQNCEISRPQK